MPASKRVSISVPLDTYAKILYLKEKMRVRSESSLMLRLLEEALENYEDPAEPRLPL